MALTLGAVGARADGAVPQATSSSGPAPRPSRPPPDEAAPPVKRQAFDGSVALGGEQLRKNLPELVWSRSYARFGAVNTIVMLLGGATTLATAIVPPIEGNRRYGGVLFDEAARNALRAPTAQGRYIARDTSDVLLSLSLTYPFFVDALVSAWWFRGNADVARQIALIDAEALAITGTLQGVTNVIAARERPYGRTCGAETPEDSIDCTTTGRYRSFFSGHAAFAFTSAGLICSHHLYLGLLGNRAADISTCVASYLGAGAAATLRIVGDNHYATDVLTGSVVGAARPPRAMAPLPRFSADGLRRRVRRPAFAGHERREPHGDVLSARAHQLVGVALLASALLHAEGAYGADGAAPNDEASHTPRPSPFDSLVEPESKRSWAEGSRRLFVGTTLDVGFLYLRPRGAVGYGKPHYAWIGVDGNPTISACWTATLRSSGSGGDGPPTRVATCRARSVVGKDPAPPTSSL
jgi:membrane-associated phospholipid phosphatase